MACSASIALNMSLSFFQYFFCTHRDNICNALIYVKYCTITIVGHTFSSFPASPWRDTELWTVWVQPLWRFDGYFHAAGDSSRRSRCKCAWFCFTSRSLLDALLTLTLTLAMLLFYFTCCCCCCRHGLASSYIDFVPMSFVHFLSHSFLSLFICTFAFAFAAAQHSKLTVIYHRSRVCERESASEVCN